MGIVLWLEVVFFLVTVTYAVGGKGVYVLL